ncbi:hypothetical protein Taro_052911 [Colocasia esculenta]|uniref:Uncharacterized protein n=1 Tax=Colocasia esculenta TaxID=4460 RepID=A0A843XLK9_COLES|nr:hypothetical protein [Colocasia esculenta]
MTLLRLPRPPLLAHPSSSHGSPPTFHRLRLVKPISASFSSSPTSGGASGQPPLSSSRIPARDRVIDFGRHRGKMLGTLPSSYLTWVSKNLRARDYEEWARLADEVLQDPVYGDRLEWEAAERVLTGVGHKASAAAAYSYAPSESAVADLLDISERFGWDNEDKEGWRRVDFRLLGTSKGGRIPRLRSGGGAKSTSNGQKGRSHGATSKVGFLGVGSGSSATRTVMSSPGKDVGGFERNSSELGGSKKDLRFQSQREDAKPASSASGAKKSSIKPASSSKKPMFTDKDCCWVHEAKKPGALNGTTVGFLSKGFRFTVGEEEEDSSMEESGKDKREERRERQKQKRKQQMRMLRREVGVDADGGDRAVASGQSGKDSSGCSNPFPGRGAILDKISRRGAF